YRVLRVGLDGILSLVAGNGQSGSGGDGGPATQAQLNGPTGFALDKSGVLYMSDGVKVRKVAPSGIITTFAGTGTSGYSGDGGAATAAKLTAAGVAVASSGN